MEIKLNKNCKAYEMGLYPYELIDKDKVIEMDSNWDSPSYLLNLKLRLEKGEKLNWWTKLKAKWL